MDAIHKAADMSRNRMTVLPGIHRLQAGGEPGARADIGLT